jgi:L-alanine-DL-glutamate epimerase-like enolase superfamily enzyme
MSSSLIIDRVELYRLSIPLVEPFITSLGKEEYAENVLVKIFTKEGVVGFGECSPYLPINGESQDTCFIVGQYFGKVLKGKNALDIEGCIQAMDKLIYANTSIKSAFDIALYDIASQHAGLPLYQFIGGKNDKTIVTDYTVSIGDPQKMAADAVKIKQQGYPAIKVKLGKDGRVDVERIRSIREAVGDEIPLRIDANQGWNLEEAIETLQALGRFDIQHCEEPIPRWQFMHLPQVKKASPIPIMADESCGDDHDAERLIYINACDYFNIKLGKSGGIYKALRMARMAEKADIHMQVGAMLESRLAMSAFAHYALCSPMIVHYDFDTALMFVEDPVTGGIRYEKNGVIKVPEVPGLGAIIDESWLRKMEKVIV